MLKYRPVSLPTREKGHSRIAASGHEESPGCQHPGLSSRAGLLQGNRRAGLFESGLALFGGLLGDTLQDSLGCTIDDGLGLAEAERGELADDLDDLDLLVAGSLEHDVECRLLLDLFGGGGTGGSRAGNGDGRRGGDLEGLLELLDELRQLDERELLERVEKLLSAELCHDLSP